MSGAPVPTGGDERVEAVARSSVGRPLTEEDLDHTAHVAALNPVSAGTYTKVRSFDFLRRLVAEVVYLREQHADVVAAQDPAPRAVPVAWGLFYPGAQTPHVVETHRHLAEQWQVSGDDPRTLEPLYRDPAPAPVVPDKADRATADLDRALARTGPFTTAAAEESKLDAATRTRARRDAGWRLVPPTGSAS